MQECSTPSYSRAGLVFPGSIGSSIESVVRVIVDGIRYPWYWQPGGIRNNQVSRVLSILRGELRIYEDERNRCGHCLGVGQSAVAVIGVDSSGVMGKLW